MNSLSWFIYLADVLENVKIMLGFVAFMGFFLSVLTVGFYLATLNERVKFPLWPGATCVIVCFSAGIISSLVPSKDTMYLIAGSEAGEMVIKDENTQEIIKDVREVIQLQLQKLKE